jgi:NAD(P)-dependent dehydrogenase (short-subunit alcohol dehydrogenase family)
MSRTYVVTGAASGIGKAVTHALVSDGHRVITVDRQNADIVADLSDEAGRAGLAAAVEAYASTIDGVICSAGLSSNSLATAQVNYFGTIATLNALQPLLAKSAAPRAIVVGSLSGTFDPDAELLQAFEQDDEVHALKRAMELIGHAKVDAASASSRVDEMMGSGMKVYHTSKRAIARWVRRHAPEDSWAGAGIALNVVAPGLVLTPMTEKLVNSPDGQALLALTPMPLNGIATADDVARVLVWFASAENTHVTGQVIFVDGGSEVSRRGVDTV